VRHANDQFTECCKKCCKECLKNHVALSINSRNLEIGCPCCFSEIEQSDIQGMIDEKLWN